MVWTPNQLEKREIVEAFKAGHGIRSIVVSMNPVGAFPEVTEELIEQVIRESLDELRTNLRRIRSDARRITAIDQDDVAQIAAIRHCCDLADEEDTTGDLIAPGALPAQAVPPR